MDNPFDTDGFFDDSDSNGSDNKGPELREPNVIEAILKKVSFFHLVGYIPP
jgi:hypothetical protein